MKKENKMSDKVLKQVSWFLVAKSLVKFVNDEKSYKLSEKVIAANDFKKYPIFKGDMVDVTIEEGVVTFLRKVKKEEAKVENPPKAETVKTAPPPETPAPEVKKEEVTPSVVGEVKELTIFAVAANKRVVKFTELKDSGWYQIDPSIQAKDYQEIGLIARNKAKVGIVENRVISFEKVAVEATEQPKTAISSPDNAKKDETLVKKEWKPQNQAQREDYWTAKGELDKKNFDVKESEKQLSIEVQAAVNSANEVVGRVAANIEPVPTANVINDMISAIAKSNYALIQELKQK